MFVLACSLLPAVASGAAAGELVVIASSAPGFSPGQLVKADAVIEIPAGASVTVVSDSGRTLTLHGPHSGPAGLSGGAAPLGLVASLSSLLAAPDKETAALGVIRRATRRDAAQPVDPWVVDVGRSGHHCVSAAIPVLLWRAVSDHALTISISNVAGEGQAEVDWPAGADTAPWPSGIVLADGAEYLTRTKGTNTVAKLTLHVAPADLRTDAHRAAWMASRGCDAQARRLLTRLR